MNFFQITLLLVYLLICLGMSVYGIHYYFMLALLAKKQKKQRKRIESETNEYNGFTKDGDLPFVTIQLPIYNERDVVDRLITSATNLDYPKDKYEIQVLDDSTDDSVENVKRIISKFKKQGFDISFIHRTIRKDYKAGALQHGLTLAKGDFLAIFDSDFVIPSNFLRRTIPLIDNREKIACVQTRWGHINRKENLLTRGVSLGIDGHFAIEQGARNYNNYYMNFNGTGGIWRKTAIVDAGGWSGDTLTEDLDLSYRVQLKGYKFEYDFDTECKAEIPNNLIAFKTQQKRWAKGSIETAIKLLPRIFRSKNIPFKKKIESFFHMTHYTISLLMIFHALLTLPFLAFVPIPKLSIYFIPLWIFILFSSFAPFALYVGSGFMLKNVFFLIAHFPVLLIIGSGICVNNSIAVLEALFGIKSGFIRTPKSGSTDKLKKKSGYKAKSSIITGLVELGLGLYSMFSIYFYINSTLNVFIVFIFAYAIGLSLFGLITLTYNIKNKIRYAKSLSAA